MKDFEKYFGFTHTGFAVPYSLAYYEGILTPRWEIFNDTWKGTITQDAKILHFKVKHTSGIPQNEMSDREPIGSFCCHVCYRQSITCDLLNNFDRDTTACESSFILLLQTNGKLIDTWEDHGVAWCETRDALVTPQRAWQCFWTRENHKVVRRCPCVIFCSNFLAVQMCSVQLKKKDKRVAQQECGQRSFRRSQLTRGFFFRQE